MSSSDSYWGTHPSWSTLNIPVFRMRFVIGLCSQFISSLSLLLDPSLWQLRWTKLEPAGEIQTSSYDATRCPDYTSYSQACFCQCLETEVDEASVSCLRFLMETPQRDPWLCLTCGLNLHVVHSTAQPLRYA